MERELLGLTQGLGVRDLARPGCHTAPRPLGLGKMVPRPQRCGVFLTHCKHVLSSGAAALAGGLAWVQSRDPKHHGTLSITGPRAPPSRASGGTGMRSALLNRKAFCEGAKPKINARAMEQSVPSPAAFGA